MSVSLREWTDLMTLWTGNSSSLGFKNINVLSSSIPHEPCGNKEQIFHISVPASFVPQCGAQWQCTTLRNGIYHIQSSLLKIFISIPSFLWRNSLLCTHYHNFSKHAVVQIWIWNIITSCNWKGVQSIIWFEFWGSSPLWWQCLCVTVVMKTNLHPLWGLGQNL